MANNKIQVKRTNVSGRTANVTSAGNAQYIDAGELALNMADGILYTSNGSSLITVGSNLVNQRITNSFSIDSNKAVRFQTVNTSAFAYFIQQNDDNFVFYSTNTSYGARAIYSIFANSNNSEFSFSAPVRFNGNVTALTANGSLGTAGQVLTSNGSTVYWSSVGGSSGTVTSVGSGNGLTGGPITTSGSLSVLANNGITVNSTGTFVTEGVGLAVNSTGVHVKANTGIIANSTGTFVNATYIGTLSANNASFLGGVAASGYQTTAGLSANVATLTANNTSFVGTVSAANVVSNAQLSSNLANYQTTAGLAANVATLTANNATNLGGASAASYVNTTGNFTVSGNINFTGTNNYFSALTQFNAGIWRSTGNGPAYWLQQDGTGRSHWYWGTAGGSSPTFAVSGEDASALTLSISNAGAGGQFFHRSASGVGKVAGDPITWTTTFFTDLNTISWKGSAIAVANGSTYNLVANNATNLGGIAAASYVQNTDSRTLSGNLNFSGANVNFAAGLFSGANVVANNTALRVGNTTLTTTNAVFGGTIAANGGIGSAGQVLTSGAAGNVYWTTPTVGTVTSVGSGNGLTGGPITTSGSLSVLANNGITANSTGTFVTEGVGLAVNSTGVHVKANTGIIANSTGTFVNWAAPSIIGSTTANGASFIYANVSGQVNTSTLLVSTNTSTFGTAAYIVSNGNLGIGTASPTAKLHIAGGSTSDATPEFKITGVSGYVDFHNSLSAGNYNPIVGSGDKAIIFTDGTSDTGNLVIAPWAASAGGLKITSGGNVGVANSSPDARLAVTGTANVSGNTRIGGVTTLAANIVLGTTTITANGSVGSAGQVLTSGAAGNVYWTTPTVGTVTSVGSGNGLTGGPITSSGSLSVLANSGITVNSTGTFVTEGVGLAVNSTGVHVRANTGIVANSTGTFVNATYIGTLSANNTTFVNGKTEGNLNVNTSATTTRVITTDSRAVTTTPETLANPGLITDFKQNTTEGLSDGGSFFGEITFRPYGIGSDWTGGPAHQLGFTSNNNIYYRSGTSTSWGSWKKLIDANTNSTLTGNLNFTAANVNFAAGLFSGANVVANNTALRVGNTTITTTNTVLGGTLAANGGIGSAGQVLTSGAAGNVYWASAAGGGYYKGGASAVGTLAGGGQNIFRVNANTLNNNTTFAAGENGQATGPIAIAAGVTLTIETGARVSIV